MEYRNKNRSNFNKPLRSELTIKSNIIENTKLFPIAPTQFNFLSQLLLTINKTISNFPFNKVNDYKNNQGNLQMYQFFTSPSLAFINNYAAAWNGFSNYYPYLNLSQGKGSKKGINLLNNGVFGLGQNNRVLILKLVFKIINAFFKSIGCLCSIPQFILHHDRLVVRIFYYQNTSLLKFNLNNLFKSGSLISFFKSGLNGQLHNLNNNTMLKTLYYRTLQLINNKKANRVIKTKILLALHTLKLINFLNKVNKNSGGSFVSFDHRALSFIKLIQSQVGFKSLNKNQVTAQPIKFKNLGIILAKIFNIHIEIQAVRIHNIGLEKKILAQMISINSNSMKSSRLLKKLYHKITLNNIKSLIFNQIDGLSTNKSTANSTDLNGKLLAQKNINPLALAKVSGLFIKIAGRTTKERITPKKTVKTFTVGNLNLNKINFVEQASFTNKNRRGSFNITIKIGHSRCFATNSFKSL